MYYYDWFQQFNDLMKCEPTTNFTLTVVIIPTTIIIITIIITIL
jgi:hypothetical protein